MKITFRAFYSYILICCLIMIGGSFFLQYGMELEPCPLCILARVSVILLSLVTFAAVCFAPKKVLYQKLISLIALIISLSGLGVTLRHVHLQRLPPEAVPDCGPGFDYIMESFPIMEALEMLLKGSGQCSEVSFKSTGSTSTPVSVVSILSSKKSNRLISFPSLNFSETS